MKDSDVTRHEQAVEKLRPREHTIERLLPLLEQALEGSRELDAEIHWLCFQPRYAAITPELEAEAYVRHAKLDYALAGTVIPHDEYVRHPTAPAFTKSLDAALTLVATDCAWQVTRRLEGTFSAVIQHRTGITIDLWVEGDGATAPLALCVAATKTRMQP